MTYEGNKLGESECHASADVTPKDGSEKKKIYKLKTRFTNLTQDLKKIDHSDGALTIL